MLLKHPSDLDKYLTPNPDTPRGRASSVRYSDKRHCKALEQAGFPKVSCEQIASYVNEFFSHLGIPTVKNPKLNLTDKNIDYKQIKQDNLTDERNIIWIKFTRDGFVGVVAKSNDINFDIPRDTEAYMRKHNGKWIHNTSGIIVHNLGKEWDKSFVLLFPIRCFPEGLNSGSIETGVGNYLISKGVPILDYYSHNY